MSKERDKCFQVVILNIFFFWYIRSSLKRHQGLYFLYYQTKNASHIPHILKQYILLYKCNLLYIKDFFSFHIFATNLLLSVYYVSTPGVKCIDLF